MVYSLIVIPKNAGRLRIMKRIIVIFVGLALVLTGCGNANLKPNQIQYEGKVLTYGATQVTCFTKQDVGQIFSEIPS